MKTVLKTNAFLYPLVGFLFSLFFQSSLQAQTTAIPDTIFEQRLILLGIDSDGLVNGQILNSDAAAITYLGVAGTQISDLTGIAAFINLDTLECPQNNLTSLDVTNLPNLTNLTCYGNQLTSLNLTNAPNLAILFAFSNSPTLEICVLDAVAAAANFNWVIDTATASYTQDCFFSLSVDGRLAIDQNSNCQVEPGESVVAGMLVLFDNGQDSIYVTTDTAGHYEANLDTGNYTITVMSPNSYLTSCPVSQSVYVGPSYVLQTFDFVFQESISCPYLEVAITNPLLRRCFSSDYYVNYCNKGTAGASNAYIEVKLDTSLYFNSSSIPIASQNGNVYQFNVGALGVDTCGSFTINVTVSCASALGEFHCTSAHIRPDSLCLSSMPNIYIADTCLGDTVMFVVTNYADAFPMALSYLIVEDTAIVDTGSIFLAMGQSITILYPSNGSSSKYQLVIADGIAEFYTASTLVGCSTGATSSNLLYLPHHAQEFLDIDCRPNRGSFDPNDKTGYPLGYSNNHYISPNGSLDYLIRFQNTGTDSAVFIIILDTLSSYLDLSTLEVEGASHPFTWEFVPNAPGTVTVLKFEFNPIYLPDSNVNESASHGFVKYSIDQKENLPNGTMINNSASIYFDYNAPVKTNTTLHAICDNCMPQNITGTSIVVSLNSVEHNKSKVVVYPNPFGTNTTIQLQEYTGTVQDLQLEIYDLTGRLLETMSSNGQAAFKVKRGNLSGGVYFFRVTEKGLLLNTGRIIAQ